MTNETDFLSKTEMEGQYNRFCHDSCFVCQNAKDVGAAVGAGLVPDDELIDVYGLFEKESPMARNDKKMGKKMVRKYFSH
ncbi:MAG: hypothetical protein IK102_01540 [Treponema sp.]|nr:hypothetical protein [Treponema sp.]